MIVIEQTSDRFSREWLIYYSDMYGTENVVLNMNKNGVMSIVVNDECKRED